MTVLGVVVRVLAILLVVRLVGRALSSLLQPRAERQARGPVDLVRDPVCKTFLPRERAIRASVGGQETHFCSSACRDHAVAALGGDAPSHGAASA